jgi:hypothetical protein
MDSNGRGAQNVVALKKSNYYLTSSHLNFIYMEEISGVAAKSN